jgi:formamidopyrimidine-DNA glycosylase
MPELPEVETVRRGLEMALKGARINGVELRRKDLRTPFPGDFAKKLAGRTIESIGRRAKYLLFYLDSDDVLIAHLGMTGRFSIEPKPPQKFAAHDHVVFTLADGCVLLFNDARRFGLMAIEKKNKLTTHSLFKHLGPEPFDKNFSPDYLRTQLLKRKMAIKPVLMDQELVVGVGNIYASEALFLAKIHPRTPAHKAAERSTKIIKAIRKVLELAIASGGSSLRDFLHVSGETGYFQHQFNVYGRKGEPCVRCGTPIQSIQQAGRSSFFCKRCQK